MAQLIEQIRDILAAYPAQVLQSPQQMAAHAGAAIGIAFAVIGTLSRTMVPLRWCAVGSNVGLVVYGILHPSPVTLGIAVALLPINAWRAAEATRLSGRVQRSAAGSAHAGLWLRPYMKPRRVKAGETLFRKGEKAEHLYLLVDGRMELAEIGKQMESARIFGEIALFSPSGLRTLTARAITDCLVLQIHGSTVKQLYFQNPSFGFHLIDLLADAHGADVARLEEKRVVQTV